MTIAGLNIAKRLRLDDGDGALHVDCCWGSNSNMPHSIWVEDFLGCDIGRNRFKQDGAPVDQLFQDRFEIIVEQARSWA